MKKIGSLVIVCMLALMIYAVYDDYSKIANTNGNILSSEILSQKYIDKELAGINIYHTKYRYKLRYHYEYYVDSIRYLAYFDNDGKNDKFINEIEILKLMDKFSDQVKVYYTMSLPTRSSINFGKLWKQRIMTYIFLAVVVTLPTYYYLA